MLEVSPVRIQTSCAPGLREDIPQMICRKPQNAKKIIIKYVIEFEIIFQQLFKLFKNMRGSKVSAGQSWMVFGVSPAVIQNYRAKMTEKGPN